VEDMLKGTSEIYDGYEQTELVEKVVYISRVAKVVKGGRRFSFSALVVVGDGEGKVGAALGKANEVPEAIRKGAERAKREMKSVPVIDGTIPHEVFEEWGATQVILKPAKAGTGVIAGSVVRAVMEAAGIRDILTKVLGSHNPHNVVKATLKGLYSLESFESIALRRDKAVEEIKGHRR